MDLFIGVDPGGRGALCALTPATGSIEFHPTPNDKVTSAEVFAWLCKWAWLKPIIGVEAVHSLPGMSARSNFSFGYNLGQIETIISAVRHPWHKVTPKIWQGKVGITFPKKCPSKDRKIITSKRCLELYPKADIYGPRGGLMDGHADSLMIAHYLSLTYGEQHESTS
jgi:hypothetical protein